MPLPVSEDMKSLTLLPTSCTCCRPDGGASRQRNLVSSCGISGDTSTSSGEFVPAVHGGPFSASLAEMRENVRFDFVAVRGSMKVACRSWGCQLIPNHIRTRIHLGSKASRTAWVFRKGGFRHG